MYDYFIEPFVSYLFLRRSLVACLALAAGCAPVGVLLVLRRMSLMGDALSHSVMPGVAAGYLIAGLSLPAMGFGGFIAGLLVAFLATLVTRHTHLKEDASFVGFYLIALALGTVMISLKGNTVDLAHILFGTILSVNATSLMVVSFITSVTLAILAIIYRPLVIECFDPVFMRSIGGNGAIYHTLFMALVVLNMVSAFQALGTLMALGMMMLPAIAARFWAREIWGLIGIAFLIAIVSGYLGLVISYQMNLPSGPTIILIAGVLYIVSLFIGPQGSLRNKAAKFIILGALGSINSAYAKPCKIVTSFSVLQDMVKTITADKCEVLAIVGPNQDAHVFEPKPSTNTLIHSADLVIINGLGFEGWMERLIQAADYDGPVTVATQQITPRYVHLPKMGDQPVADPHAWHTIPNALLYLNTITASLIEHFPDYTEAFQQNAQVYRQQLEALETDLQTMLSNLPASKRQVITAHDAFSYLGAHYGIRFSAPVGISTEAQPSAKQIAELIDQIRSLGIQAIFIENIANEQVIRQLAEETKIQVNPALLYSDALSEANGPAPTYIAMMRHNMRALIEAMQRNP